ncbi:MAG: hypothetical protein N2652_08410 [Kiritimatiellae bacterium]|nr:hypothetical protein [Kiritimatiellia bacterium]
MNRWSLVAAPLLTGIACASERVPFPMDWTSLPRCALGLERYLDPPAGRHGFLREREGHLAFEDGTPFRIWGVNLTGAACAPEPEHAAVLADRLARLGVNAVRFHMLDGGVLFVPGAADTRRLDPHALDRMDRLVAELKRRGIYVNLNLNAGRRYRPADGVRDAPQLHYAKGATFFNPRLIELQHEFARQLLTHSNPYTGAEYRAEPAVATIELVNENSLLEAWVTGRLVGQTVTNPHTWSPLPVSYAEELTALYNNWLRAHCAPAELARLRQEAGAPADAPVPRLRPAEFASASPLRFRTEARFYFETELSFFRDMRRLLKEELRVRPPVVATADHNDRFAAYAHILANAELDWIDGHGYWQHPNVRADPPTIANTPMVNDPFDSTVVQFARTPLFGRAFTISEVNHPFPHEFACEGVPILAAYAMLHDWDGVYWYTWDHGRPEPSEGGIAPRSYFDLCRDPMKIASLVVGAAMWHARAISPARSTLVRCYSTNWMLDALRMDRRESPLFTPGWDRTLTLVHATRWRHDDAPTQAPPPPPPPERIISDTGELGWFDAPAGRGVVTVDSPAAQAVIGHLREGGPAPRHLRPRVQNAFAAVTLVSLDRHPLGASRRLLLGATSWSGHPDMRWNERRNAILEWGRGPVHIEVVRGHIELIGLAAHHLVATPLTAAGAPVAATLPVRHEGDRFILELGAVPALLYLIELER